MTRVLALLVILLAPAASIEPKFNGAGELMRPENYREWIYLTSGLGMTYREPAAANDNPRFDNVFVTPDAYHAFLDTGKWPEKTMFALEVRNAGSKASINKGGHFQESVEGLEIEVKSGGKWTFYPFDAAAKTAKAFPGNSICNKCHDANGAVDSTFVQFYPTLISVAKAKGTFKATDEK